MTERERMLLSAYERLVVMVNELRRTQRDYMKNRGDEDFGKRVAEAASSVDEVLVCIDLLKAEYS